MKSIKNLVIIIALIGGLVAFGRPADDGYDRAPMNETVKKRQMSGANGESPQEVKKSVEEEFEVKGMNEPIEETEHSMPDVDRSQGEMTVEEVDADYGYDNDNVFEIAPGSAGGASYSGY